MSTDTVETFKPLEGNEQRYDADHVANEVGKRLPAAHEAIYGVCVRTPLADHSPGNLPGLRVLTKLENRQVGRSFKSRGAVAAVDEFVRQHPEQKIVTTASAGNHLQGVAHAARAYGLKVIGFTADDISPVKAERAAALGVALDSSYATLELAMKAADSESFIHPYDHYETMAGQGTLLTETLEDLVEQGVDVMKDEVVITVPVGGGGLLAGMAVCLYELKNAGHAGLGISLVGVQMENCDAARRFRDKELEDGQAFRPSELDRSCDGTAVARPGDKTRAILEDPRFVREILSVSKAEVGGAMQRIFTELRVMAEPAGALAWAAADKMRAGYAVSDRTDSLALVNILSGANVSDETWEHFADEYLGRNALHAKTGTTDWRTHRQNILRAPTTLRPVPHPAPSASYRSAHSN